MTGTALSVADGVWEGGYPKLRDDRSDIIVTLAGRMNNVMGAYGKRYFLCEKNVIYG